MAKRLEEILLERLREDPTAPCIWWKGTWWTREDLSRLVRNCEAVLSRSGFREGLRLEDRLARASRSAQAAGVDVTRERAAIARRVEAIERIQQAATGLDERIDEIERHENAITALDGKLDELTAQLTDAPAGPQASGAGLEAAALTHAA